MNAGNDLISRAYESEADYDLMRRIISATDSQRWFIGEVILP